MGVVKAKGDDAKASKYIGELILGGKIWGVFLVFFAILATFWLFWVIFNKDDEQDDVIGAEADDAEAEYIR